MVPVCLRIIEDAIRFLCEDDGEEPEDPEEAGGGEYEHEYDKPSGLGWASMSSRSLALQQTLHAVAQSIIEFLGDARDTIRAGEFEYAIITSDINSVLPVPGLLARTGDRCATKGTERF